MNLKIILGLLLAFVFYRFCHYWLLKKNLISTHFDYDVAKNKDKFIILWDIHGVIFVKSIIHWAYLIITYDRLFEAILNLNRESYIILFKYILKKIGLSQQEITNEELIHAAKKGNNLALIDLITVVACDYERNEKVIALMEELHNQGYRQQVASNIGETIFKKFYSTHISVFKNFESFFIVKIREDCPLLKKPDPNYFYGYLKEQNINPRYILFIDDRLDNVIAAQKAGINAILFESDEQLKKEFFCLNLFPKA